MMGYRFVICREFIWCVVGLKYTGSPYDVFVFLKYPWSSHGVL